MTLFSSSPMFALIAPLRESGRGTGDVSISSPGSPGTAQKPETGRRPGFSCLASRCLGQGAPGLDPPPVHPSNNNKPQTKNPEGWGLITSLTSPNREQKTPGRRPSSPSWKLRTLWGLTNGRHTHREGPALLFIAATSVAGKRVI